MTTNNKKTSRLTDALLETANDMRNTGIMSEAAYEKITMPKGWLEKYPAHLN